MKGLKTNNQQQTHLVCEAHIFCGLPSTSALSANGPAEDGHSAAAFPLLALGEDRSGMSLPRVLTGGHEGGAPKNQRDASGQGMRTQKQNKSQETGADEAEMRYGQV